MSRILITGAARGIGAACALAYAATGARLVLADLHTCDATAEQARRAGAAEVLNLTCDVADADAVAAMATQVQSAFGGLDVLVHCAGIIHEAPLLDTPIADFDRVIAVNLRGTFLVGQAAIRLMTGTAQAPARVILIASDMAYYGRETFSAYVFHLCEELLELSDATGELFNRGGFGARADLFRCFCSCHGV